MVFKRLIKEGAFYVDQNFDAKMLGPKTVIIDDHKFYRFMDFFYLPAPANNLTYNQIVEICDLRLKYFSYVIDLDLNKKIVSLMVNFVKNKLMLKMNGHLKILDFACGSGDFYGYIKQKLPEIHLFGLDISKCAINRAVKNGLNATCISINEPFPFKENFFDVVFAVFVMHFNLKYIPFNELYRTVKEDGYLIFNVYNQNISELINLLSIVDFIHYNNIEKPEILKSHMIMIFKKGNRQ